MLRKLQNRAGDLTECLLISELEMRRSRTLEKKLEAYHDFGSVVDRIDALRRDIEELIHWDAKESIMADLDQKVASVMRSRRTALSSGSIAIAACVGTSARVP